MLCLSPQLWRRLQGQPLLQRYSMCVQNRYSVEAFVMNGLLNTTKRYKACSCLSTLHEVAVNMSCQKVSYMTTEKYKTIVLSSVHVLSSSFEDDTSYPPPEEKEENNFIEPEAPRTPQKPRPEPPNLPAPVPTKPPAEDMQKNEVVNTQQMCKLSFNC